jgi:sodium/bile acid cotransporter 7
VRRFFIQRWFLIVLVAVLVVGTLGHKQLEPIAGSSAICNAVVATVLFLMALPLEAATMWQSIRRPWATLLAVAITFGLLPLFAWAVSLGLSREMAPGLLVAAATPCTLASASVWTRRAGGNDSVSILVTVVTNAACFLVSPLWLALLIGPQVAQADLNLGDLVVKLALLVVLPMAVAQLLRVYRPLARLASRGKLPLGVAAQLGVLSMVLFGAVQTAERMSGAESAGSALFDIAIMAAGVMLVHLAMLAVGLWLARLLRFTRGDQIAVAFAGSQKTLMVGLHLCVELNVVVLPMVVYHVGQLLVDTFIADRMRRRGSATEQTNQPPPQERDPVS